MRNSRWTPSIVPRGDDHTVYLVLDDLGPNGRIWPEADFETTDLETVTVRLLTGQYKNPIRVVAFNTAEGWSRDVSSEVAHELRHRCDLQLRDVPFSLQDFVDRYEGRYHDYSYRYRSVWPDCYATRPAKATSVQATESAGNVAHSQWQFGKLSSDHNVQSPTLWYRARNTFAC
jgi:hypothetical protein